MKFISFFTERPISAFMVYAMCAIFGIFAFYRMPVDLMPGGDSGVLTIFVGVRGGLPPEDIESLITKIVEDERAVVTLNFKVGTDTARAALDVQERLAKIKGKLPKEIEKPVVSRYDESQSPVMILAMSSKHYTPEEMREIADNQLKPTLKRVNGVANIEVGGGREKKILVEFDQSRLEAYALPIRQVISQIGTDNLNILTGKVERERDSYLLRTVGAYKTLEDLGNLPIAVTKEGSRIRLKDVAEIRDFYMEAESYSRLNREPVVSVYIQKEALANTISTAKDVKKAADEFKKTLDPRISFSVVSDQSIAVEKALNNLKGSLFQGAFLVGAILVIFLKNFISASFIFISIPLSLVITLAVMHLFGLSLNVMTISGLAIASGQVVDNSIVVLENIYQYRIKFLQFVNRWDKRFKKTIPALYQKLIRFDSNGEIIADESLMTKTFAVTASNEMLLVLVANTLTAIVVFLPIVFLNPQVRLLYMGLSITVTAALLISLLVAVSTIPSLSANIPAKWTKQSSFFSAYFWLWLRQMYARSVPFYNFLIFHGQKWVRKLNKFDFFKKYFKKIFKFYTAIFICDILLLLFLPNIFYSKLWVRITQITLIVLYMIALIIRSLITDEDMVYSSNVRRELIATKGGYQGYRHMVAWIMRRRFRAALLILVLLVGTGFLYKYLDKEFVGTTEENEFIIFVELPSGTKLDVSDKVVSEVEKVLNQLPEVQKSVKTSVARVEGWSSKIYVTLLPATERTKTTQEVMSTLRPVVSQIGKEYGAFIYFSEPVSSKEFVIDVYGYDYNQLRDMAVKIAQNMEQVKGLADIKLRYKPGRPEVKIEIDREKASLFEFSIHDIAESLHAQIRGLRATYFITPTAQIETVARLQEQYRKTLEDIQNLSLVNPKGTIVPVRQFAIFEFGLTPSEVWRKSRERMIQVSANRGDIALSKVAEGVIRALKQLPVPTGYYWEIGGDFPKMIETEKESQFAFLIMVLLVYAILAGLFESYTQPFIILVAVPLSLIGAIPLLYVTHTPITLGTLIGFIMLGGIAVNNSTILVEVFNNLRQEKNVYRALLQSGQERIRPIVATTLTNITGMFPLVFQGGGSGSLWAPMAITVIGGMTVSTILILFVLPAFYLIMIDIQVWCAKQTTLILEKIVTKKLQKV